MMVDDSSIVSTVSTPPVKCNGTELKLDGNITETTTGHQMLNETSTINGDLLIEDSSSRLSNENKADDSISLSTADQSDVEDDSEQLVLHFSEDDDDDDVGVGTASNGDTGLEKTESGTTGPVASDKKDELPPALNDSEKVSNPENTNSTLQPTPHFAGCSPSNSSLPKELHENGNVQVTSSCSKFFKDLGDESLENIETKSSATTISDIQQEIQDFINHASPEMKIDDTIENEPSNTRIDTFSSSVPPLINTELKEDSIGTVENEQTNNEPITVDTQINPDFKIELTKNDPKSMDIDTDSINVESSTLSTKINTDLENTERSVESEVLKDERIDTLGSSVSPSDSELKENTEMSVDTIESKLENESNTLDSSVCQTEKSPELKENAKMSVDTVESELTNNVSNIVSTVTLDSISSTEINPEKTKMSVDAVESEPMKNESNTVSKVTLDSSDSPIETSPELKEIAEMSVDTVESELKNEPKNENTNTLDSSVSPIKINSELKENPEMSINTVESQLTKNEPNTLDSSVPSRKINLELTENDKMSVDIVESEPTKNESNALDSSLSPTKISLELTENDNMSADTVESEPINNVSNTNALDSSVSSTKINSELKEISVDTVESDPSLVSINETLDPPVSPTESPESVNMVETNTVKNESNIVSSRVIDTLDTELKENIKNSVDTVETDLIKNKLNDTSSIDTVTLDVSVSELKGIAETPVNTVESEPSKNEPSPVSAHDDVILDSPISPAEINSELKENIEMIIDTIETDLINNDSNTVDTLDIISNTELKDDTETELTKNGIDTTSAVDILDSPVSSTENAKISVESELTKFEHIDAVLDSLVSPIEVQNESKQIIEDGMEIDEKSIDSPSNEKQNGENKQDGRTSEKVQDYNNLISDKAEDKIIENNDDNKKYVVNNVTDIDSDGNNENIITPVKESPNENKIFDSDSGNLIKEMGSSNSSVDNGDSDNKSSEAGVQQMEISDDEEIKGDNLKSKTVSLKRALETSSSSINEDMALNKKSKLNGIISESKKPKQYITLSNVHGFMIKKMITRMTKSDLEEFCLMKICEAINQNSKIGELQRQNKIREQKLTSLRSKYGVLLKQIRDLEIVHTKTMGEVRQKIRENLNPKDVAPVKITRSVGLQVNLQAFNNRPRPATPAPDTPRRKVARVSAPPKVNTSPSPVKQSPQMKTLSNPTHIIPVVQTTVNTGPSNNASTNPKGIKTILPKVYSGSEVRELQHNSLLGSYLQKGSPNLVNTTSKKTININTNTNTNNTSNNINTTSNTNATTAAPVTVKISNNTAKVIDLTDEDDPANNSGRVVAVVSTNTTATTTTGNIRIVAPQHLLSTPNSSSNSVTPQRIAYVIPTSGQQQVLLTSTTNVAPRGGQVRPTFVIKPVPTGQVPPNQRMNIMRPPRAGSVTVWSPSNPTGTTTRPTVHMTTANIPTSLPTLRAQSTSPVVSRVGKHPAPLPGPPAVQSSQPNWKAMPPKPSLKLSRAGDGIVLSWKILNKDLSFYEEIASYQLYAYQETNAAPTTDMWRKVGDVKALALPMACTLTQFTSGNTYHLAVRAVDVKSRVGPFSPPEQISLP